MPQRIKPAEYFIKRFWAHVIKQDDGCWLWQGARNNNGYGKFYPGGGRHVEKVYVHRYAYELLVEPIPEGLDIDHLCRVRSCVNPAHLEPVTHRENMLRGETIAAKNAARTHCPRGHALTVHYDRGRRCVECHERGTFNGDKTHCKWGHEFTEQNTYWEPSGKGRACRTCRTRRDTMRPAR